MKRTNVYWLVLFVLIVALPLLAGLGYALLYSLGLTGVLARGFTLEHWSAVFTHGEILESILYSAIIGVLSIGLAGGIAMVLVLRYPKRLARGWPGLARYLPLCIPPVAAGFFSFQFLTNGGWLSSLTQKMGFIATQQDFPALVQDRFAIGIILTHVLLALPFFLLLMGSLYDRLGLPALLLQARSLGASPSVARSKVGRMVLLRAAFPTLMLYTIFVTGAYEIPLLLGRQSPQMVSVLTVRYLRHYDLQLIPQAYIVAICYAFVVFTLLLLVYRWLVPKT